MTDDIELITELQRLFTSQPAVEDEEPGVTFVQLQKAIKAGQGTLRARLRELAEAGLIEAVNTTRPNITKVRKSHTVVYRPITQDGEGV